MSAPRRCNDNWSWVHVQLLAGPPQHVHQSKSSPSKAGYITEKEALKSFIECVRERRVGGWWYQILEELLLFSKPTCANCISSASLLPSAGVWIHLVTLKLLCKVHLSPRGACPHDAQQPQLGGAWHGKRQMVTEPWSIQGHDLGQQAVPHPLRNGFQKGGR